MTPREFFLMVDGYELRQSNEDERMAWAIAHVINGCSQGRTHAVSIEDVLGRPLRANYDPVLAAKDKRRRQQAEGR